MRYLFIALILVSCRVPQKSTTQQRVNVEEKTVFRYDTVTVKHTKRVPEIVKVPKYLDSLVCPKDTTYITKTIYKAKKIKIKDSHNVDNSEVIRLKNAMLVKDSQIDSLTAIVGKGSGETNNGTKWWVFVLLGMVIGIAGYQGVRSAITKKW